MTDNTAEHAELELLSASHSRRPSTPSAAAANASNIKEEIYYNWQVWPGKNRPLFKGACLLGPDRAVLLTNVLLITGNSVLFDVFVATQVNIAVVIVGVFLMMVSLLCLGLATCTEPGILPRQPPLPEQYRTAGAPPTMDFRGRSVPLKYCETCHIWRPPRTKHCRDCDNCVKQFDHHCPWVCNCVGERNYKYFVLFVFSTCLLDCYTLFFCGYVLVTQANESTLVDAMLDNFVATVEFILCCIFAWCLCSLGTYHCYLLVNGTTTNEQIKGISIPSGSSRCQNCWTLFFSSPSESLLRLRAPATTRNGTHAPLLFMQEILEGTRSNQAQQNRSFPPAADSLQPRGPQAQTHTAFPSNADSGQLRGAAGSGLSALDCQLHAVDPCEDPRRRRHSGKDMAQRTDPIDQIAVEIGPCLAEPE